MREERRKARALAILILFSLMVILSAVALSASAGPLTRVNTDLEDGVEIDVSPGSDGEAVVSGTVTCQTTNPTPCIVNLVPITSVGSVSITPPNVVFQGGGIQTKEFEVTIQVPLLTNASEDESCFVAGSWQQGGTSGLVTSDPVGVIILPFYRITLFSEKPVMELGQGDSTEFDLRMQNTGNCPADYLLEIANMERLIDNEVKVECPGTISFETGQIHLFTVDVRTSSDTPKQGHHIVIKATSQCPEDQSDQIFEQEYQLIAKVVGIQLSCGLIHALQYTAVAAAVVIAGVVVYKKKFRTPPVLENGG